MSTETPLVSVRMITYNHEKYIAQAIEGVLMQKTNFPFELIIGEDCSTDRTREIVVDYANRYPDIIKPILHEKNVGAKANSQSVGEACTGKYVALCEGDDYWIDPLKLQKQVDFMESHPECSECHTRAIIVDEEGKTLGRVWPPRSLKKVLSTRDLLKRSSIITASCMYRNRLLPNIPDFARDYWAGDRAIHILNSQCGSIILMKDITAAYRLNLNGASKSITQLDKLKSLIPFYEGWNKYFNSKYEVLITKLISRTLCQIAQVYAENGQMEFAKCFFRRSFSKVHFNRYAFVQNIKTFLSIYSPEIFKFMKSIKR